MSIHESSSPDHSSDTRRLFKIEMKIEKSNGHTGKLEGENHTVVWILPHRIKRDELLHSPNALQESSTLRSCLVDSSLERTKRGVARESRRNKRRGFAISRHPSCTVNTSFDSLIGKHRAVAYRD